MGSDRASRNSYHRDKLDGSEDDSKESGGRSYSRRTYGDKEDPKQCDGTHDGANFYRGSHSRRQYHDRYKQNAYSRGEPDSRSNTGSCSNDGGEESAEHTETYMSRTGEMAHDRNYRETAYLDRDRQGSDQLMGRSNRDHYLPDRTLKDEKSHRNGGLEVRADRGRYPRGSDYSPRNEETRRYSTHGKPEGSYKRPKHASADPNNTLGIFGLSQFITEDEMRAALTEKLPEMKGYSFKMVMDERTGLCKGFCFVDFVCLNDAMSAKDILNNESFRGQDFRCDYSYKQRPLGG